MNDNNQNPLNELMNNLNNNPNSMTSQIPIKKEGVPETINSAPNNNLPNNNVANNPVNNQTNQTPNFADILNNKINSNDNQFESISHETINNNAQPSNNPQTVYSIGNDPSKIIATNRASFIDKNGQDKYIRNDELLYYYVGKNYEKFVTKSFNFSAFFFSIAYLLYRKMYGFTFIIMVASIVMSYFIKNPVYLAGASFAINLVLGIIANKRYISFCNNKIINIKSKYPYFDKEQLIAICKKKGGTSILSIILGFIFNIVIIVAITFVLFFVILKKSINDIFDDILGSYGINYDFYGAISGKMPISEDKRLIGEWKLVSYERSKNDDGVLKDSTFTIKENDDCNISDVWELDKGSRLYDNISGNCYINNSKNKFIMDEGIQFEWTDYEVSGNALKFKTRIYEKIVKEVNDEKESTN